MSLDPKVVVDQCAAEFAAGRASRDVEVERLVEALRDIQARDWHRGTLMLDAEDKCRIDALLRELSRDARARADKAWASHKAPMAAYWKATAVYARHAAVLLKGGLS